MSLRWLLLGATAVGMLSGIFGPTVLRVIREYNSAPPPLPEIPVQFNTRVHEDESNGYFESAETPLH